MKYALYINYYHKNGMNAREIYNKLKEQFPLDCPSYSSITYFLRMKTCKPKKRSVKIMPKKQPNYYYLKKIKKAIEAEPWLSARKIAKRTHIPKSTVSYHLTHYLGYTWRRTTYVPHMLTNEQKNKRIEGAKHLLFMLEQQKKTNFKYFVTGDESWFYYDVIPPYKWVKGGEKPPTKPREKFDTKKVLITIFWSIDGIEYISALDEGKSYNSTYFCANVIDNLLGTQKYLRAQSRNKRYVLHMDNSPVHNSKKTTNYIKETRITRPDHPPYSPDLAPSDFWLFGALDSLKPEAKFNSADEIVDWVRDQFLNFSPDLIKSVFAQWEERLHQCIECGGDYIQDM